MFVSSAKESVQINYTGYASGIYLLTLINDEQEIIHRKMILTQ
jgi:hypothetical protein